jgi:hypothetical protein
MFNGPALSIPFLITPAWRNFVVACYSEASQSHARSLAQDQVQGTRNPVMKGSKILQAVAQQSEHITETGDVSIQLIL